MNERIKQLAAQLGEPSTWGAERPVGPGFAGSRWSGWSDCQQELRGYNTPLYDTAQLEKFAELIVKECIGIIVKENDGDEYGSGNDWGDGYTAGLNTAKLAIEEHFEIKEN
jgi:hypothetical protein